MGIFLAFIAGWAFGSQGGKQEYDDVVAAAVAIKESEEFATMLAAVRHHAGYLLRQAADILLAESSEAKQADAFIDRVRSMVQPGASRD